MARVLVIDDDQAIVDLLRSVLAEAGHQVVVPGHAPHSELRVEVVITDLELPGGYDPALARASVGQVRSEFGVPVVVCTAHRGAAEEPDKLGADEVIAKPFDVEALVHTVERLARG